MFVRAAEQKAGQVGVGRAVAHLREQAGLSLAELASRSEVSDTELEVIERGDVDPTWGRLRRIAYGMKVDLDNLIQLGVELAPGPAGDRLRQKEDEKRDFRGSANDGPTQEGQGS